MLYVRELIDLMAAFPGRDFKMIDLVRYAANGRTLDNRGKRALREGVLRAVKALAGTGAVLIRPPSQQRGGYAVYRWKSDT